jgi:hypothetical protein
MRNCCKSEQNIVAFIGHLKRDFTILIQRAWIARDIGPVESNPKAKSRHLDCMNQCDVESD